MDTETCIGAAQQQIQTQRTDRAQMHQCLLVQDVLQVICDFVLEDPGSANKTLIAFARTCRSISEVVLNALWSTQTSLVPLLKCLPRSLWRETGKDFEKSFCFIREIREKDFERFNLYASRIKRLRHMPNALYNCPVNWDDSKNPFLILGNDSSIPFDLAYFASLHYYRVDLARQSKHAQIPLLPNLRWMEFSSPVLCLSRTEMFLESGLLSLSIDWPERYEVPHQLFSDIQKFSPYLEELELDTIPKLSIEASAVFSKFICGMKHLRRVKTKSYQLNSEALLHLASLPYFHTLEVPNSPSDFLNAISESSKEDVFTNLQHLSMQKVKDFPSLWKLIRRIQPLQLQSISVGCKTLPTEEELQELFHVLSVSVSSFSLRHILINLPGGLYELRSSRLAIKSSTLSLLINFPNLTSFTLSIPAKFELNDLDIIQLASGWPRLQKLQLGLLCGWGMSSLITFDGLLGLLEHCAQLEHLGIVFNASKRLPSSLNNLRKFPVNRRIAYLNIGDSDIEDSTTALLFLKRVLPCVRGISGVWNFEQVDSSSNMRAEIRNTRWLEVAEQLGKRNGKNLSKPSAP